MPARRTTFEKVRSNTQSLLINSILLYQLDLSLGSDGGSRLEPSTNTREVTRAVGVELAWTRGLAFLGERGAAALK